MANQATASHLDVNTKVGYGFGHICNDIFATLQASYAILFYQNVLHMEKSNAGMIYLIGQIADAFTSPIIGILSDLDLDIWLCRTYGRRKVNKNQRDLGGIIIKIRQCV